MAVTFPGESPEYRRARDELLTAERELRKKVEDVAALRRRMPVGGLVPEDYVFEALGASGEKRKVHLSELFEPGKDTLLLYSYMYGPAMKRPCPMCTSFLDGMDGQSPHIRQSVPLHIVAKSPIERIHELARERGWRNLSLLSSAGTTYNRDYHGETAEGSQLPSMNVFVRRDGKIHHFYNTELLFAPMEPGQASRHIDLMWPLWQVLDLTPEGRGTDWNPQLSYEDA